MRCTLVWLNAIDLISQLSEILLFCYQRKDYSNVFWKSDEWNAVLRFKASVENLFEGVSDLMKSILRSLILNINEKNYVFILMLKSIAHFIQVLRFQVILAKNTLQLLYSFLSYSHIIDFTSTLYKYNNNGVTIRWVKHLAASLSLFKFLNNRPLCRRYFCLRITSGIIGASSLPSLIRRIFPFSMKLIRQRVDSRTFSAVNIFLLFRLAKAQQIVILIIKSIKRGCFLLGTSGSMGTLMLLYAFKASLSSLSTIYQLMLSLMFWGV